MARQARSGRYFCVLAVIAGLLSLLDLVAGAEAEAQRVIADRPVVTRGPESLAAMLEPYCEKYGLPALGAAIMKEGRLVAMGVVGTRKAGEKIPVASNDRFHIGSNTKAITSLLAAMFVKEGKLRWDSRLEEIFPELSKTMAPGLGSITLEQLLSHSSGMPPDEPLGERLAAEAYTREKDNLSDTRYWMVSRWVSQPIAAAPRRKYNYSNMGYVLVGAILEKVSGKSWEQLVIERIFAPLRLRSAGFGPQSSLGVIDAPLPHRMVDGKIKAMMAGPSADNPLFIGPAGTVHMSLQDFARWASWNAGKGKRAPQLIPAEMFVKLATPLIDLPKSSGRKGLPERGGYALGWVEAHYPWSKEPFVWHNGSNEMNLAHIFIQPKTDFAMVLMTNISNPGAEEAFGQLAEELYKKYGSR